MFPLLVVNCRVVVLPLVTSFRKQSSTVPEFTTLQSATLKLSGTGWKASCPAATAPAEEIPVSVLPLIPEKKYGPAGAVEVEPGVVR